SALQYADSSPSASSQHPDATVDAANPSYRPPVLFTRPAPVGAVAATLAALSVVTPEQMPIEPVDGNCCHFDRQQGQLEAIRQLLTGAGYSYSTAQGAIANVPPGLIAGWRTDPPVQRVLVDVTDQPFDRTGPITFTQPVTPPGDPSLVIPGLVAQRVHHVGLVVGGRVDAVDALSRLSAATGTVVPAGGLACGGSDGHWRVPAGAPFVCTASAAQLAIESAVLHLTSPTHVLVSAGASAVSRSGMLGAQTVDSYLAQSVVTALPVTCPISATGRTVRVPVTATVRGVIAASGAAVVRCDPVRARPGAPRPAAVPPVETAPAPAPAVGGAAPAAPSGGQPQVNPQPGQQEQQAPAAALGTAPQDELATQLAEQRHDDSAGFLFGAAGLLGAAATAVARRRAHRAEKVNASYNSRPGNG
ncbi:MAG: hypothetical protein JO079_00460, partial [Frankiaceae bacterium]|nr:hypothetical protein [Frankiaceae bacterium]